MAEASQLQERYGSWDAAKDEVRDALLEAGPNPADHRQALLNVAEASPELAADLFLIVVTQGGDDAEAADEALLSVLRRLHPVSAEPATDPITEDAVNELQSERVAEDDGAEVISRDWVRLDAALTHAVVSARLNGKLAYQAPAE